MAVELIIALDLETRGEVMDFLPRLEGTGCWVKVGLQLFTRYGPPIVEEIAARGFPVFLDLKLHDIPNTVARSIQSLASLPIGMLTLHTAGGREMMSAAVAAAQQYAPELLLLGVTVLTSMDDDALLEIGVEDRATVQVLRLARLAREAGLRGLVCSPLEVTHLQDEFAGEMTLVTPGIRPPGSASDEQKRIATPAQAREMGSDYIVVGRPVLRAEDPRAVVESIRKDLQ